MTPTPLRQSMRRVGVVGDGLSGLLAGLGATSKGAEAAIFGRSEPVSYTHLTLPTIYSV